MNHNQLLLKEALTKGFQDALFTHTKYREILDVCLAALEEPTQSSEPKQVDLKDLQFYFDNAYSDNIAKFGHDLIYYVNTGVLKAKEKDKRLFGMQPSIIMFDEMHTHIQPGGVFDKFKNLVQVKKNKKDEAVHVPADAVIKPEPIESKLLTTEGMKKILMNSGYAVIDNQEFSENYIDVRTLRNQTGYEKWLFKKANEFRRKVLDVFGELYENKRITFEEYADKVASVDYWRMQMNSEPKEEQLDELYKHKTNVFRQEPTVQGEIKFKRLEGATFIKEPDEKDEYDAAMAEWRESFNAWKEKDAEADERINEIADKVNKIYAVLNERVHPLVKRIDNDVYQVKKQTEASVNKSNTTIHYTGGQMTEEQANEFVTRMKNELAKSMREERLKGGK